MPTNRFDDFEDDVVGVPNEAILYRRVDWDRVGGRDRCPQGASPKLNGNCFTDYALEKAVELGYPGPCMSVGVSTVLGARNCGPERMLERFPGNGLAEVRAGDLRTLKRPDGAPCPQGIMLAATDDEPWHGVVFDLAVGLKSAATKNAIARLATWTIPLVNL